MNSFLEDIEFASKVNEEIKRAEQRGIDNSLELTKEMIKQQYGDIEKLEQENKQLKEQKEKIYLWAIDSKCKLDTLPPNYSYVIDGNRLKELFEILGDKE